MATIEGAWKINGYDDLYHIQATWKCGCGKRNKSKITSKENLDSATFKCVACGRESTVEPYKAAVKYLKDLEAKRELEAESRADGRE